MIEALKKTQLYGETNEQVARELMFSSMREIFGSGSYNKLIEGLKRLKRFKRLKESQTVSLHEWKV